MRGVPAPAVALAALASAARAQNCTPAAGVIDASTCGYDADDATAALQAAINSGAATVIVPKGTVWYVTPITLAARQRVVVQDGAVIRAKRGEFHDPNACLLSGTGLSDVSLVGEGNATIAMWRDDYANKTKYTKSESRMAVMLHHVYGFEIRNLHISYSGGDGIYLVGVGRGHIDNVRCMDNYRQGMSVIEAQDVVIENSEFSRTRGTAPGSGVDFENNRATQVFQNVTLRNCTAKGNAGKGFEVSMHGCPDSGMSVVFDQLHVVVDHGNPGMFFHTACDNATSQFHTFNVTNSYIETNGGDLDGAGIYFYEMASAFQAVFRNIVINATAPKTTPVVFKPTHRFATGNVTMTGIEVWRTGDSPWCAFGSDPEPHQHIHVDATVHGSAAACNVTYPPEGQCVDVNVTTKCVA